MNLRINNKLIGLRRLKRTFFFNTMDYDTNVMKSYVIQFGLFHKEPAFSYVYGYKMWNFLIARIGYTIELMEEV